jgi:AAA+ ATPase superfamily predicted ATPase
MFINRESELTHLEEEYSKDTPRFIILYGRRRIGKTALIEEFGKNKKDFIYFLADQQTEIQQIESFKQQVYEYTHDDFLQKTRFDNWDQFFSYLTKILPADKRFIIGIDEITYLIKSTPAFLSILQKYWDTFFQKTKIFLIVSGSLVGMMVREVLNYDSPVYGRRTSQIHLKAFNFKNASKMLKNFGIEEQIELFSITGGVAKYLLLIEEKSIDEFIRKKIIEKEGFFYQEGIFLLSQEFKSPNVYLSILKAIALGHTKLNEISNFAGIEGKKITRYLDVLHEIGLVTRQVPITEDPLKFRKGVYVIEDNFLKFWFRFVLPNRSRIELRDTKDLLKNILDSLPDYASETFEHIGSEFLQEISRSGKLPAKFTHWGKWWDRLNEIDIVAINDDTLNILICECKWKKRKADADAIKHLLDKAPNVKWFNENRKEHLAFISKAGFTGEAVRIADENGVMLFDLKDMERYYRLL